MVMVSTINGKITKRDDPDIYKWTSKEDQEYFFNLLQKNKVKIMGSTTYEAIKKNLKLQKGNLRIVLTKNPSKYDSDFVAGQLEFSNELPHALIQRLKKKGIRQVLVLGGGKINASFLKGKLVDELYLTLEPRIFGKGKSIFDEGIFEEELTLISIKKLNKKGALFLKYRSLKYDSIEV